MAKSNKYYRILQKYGLSTNATYEEINQFRRRKLKQSHPDLNRVNPNATRIFQEINSDTSFLLLEWEKEEFINILNSDKNNSNRKIINLCNEYLNKLYRVDSLEQLRRLKSTYKNKVAELVNERVFYEEKKLKEEIEKFKQEVERFKKYTYDTVKNLCNETLKSLDDIKTIKDLNNKRINFENQLIPILKKELIQELNQTKNTYNDLEISKLCDKFIRKISSEVILKELHILYCDYQVVLSLHIAQYNKKLNKLKSEFIDKLNTDKAKYNFIEIAKLCDIYKSKIETVKFISHLDNIIREYEYGLVTILREKFKEKLNYKQKDNIKDREIKSLCSEFLELIPTIQSVLDYNNLYDEYLKRLNNISAARRREFSEAKSVFRNKVNEDALRHQELNNLCKEVLNGLESITDIEKLHELEKYYNKQSFHLLREDFKDYLVAIKKQFPDEEINEICDEALNILETISAEKLLDFRKEYREKIKQVLSIKFPSEFLTLQLEAKKQEFREIIERDKEKLGIVFVDLYEIVLMSLANIKSMKELESLKQYYNNFFTKLKLKLSKESRRLPKSFYSDNTFTTINEFDSITNTKVHNEYIDNFENVIYTENKKIKK